MSDLRLNLVGEQEHYDAPPLSRLRYAVCWESILDGSLIALIPYVSYDDLQAAVPHVQGLGSPLVSIPYDCDGFTLKG